MTGEEAGGRLERSGSWVSRVEAGRTGLRVRDVRDLLNVYGVVDPALRSELEELARVSKEKGWWAQFSEHNPLTYTTYIGLEDAATSLFIYEDSVVPGLLQTERYMRSVHRIGIRPLDPQVEEARVRVRLQRQKILQRANAPSLDVILDESVLYRAYPGPEALREQLASLTRLARRPAVRVQIIPFANAGQGLIVSSFTILGFLHDPDIAYVESHTGGSLHSGADVEDYHATARRLRLAALPVKQSIALMQGAHDKL